MTTIQVKSTLFTHIATDTIGIFKVNKKYSNESITRGIT